MIDLHSHVLPGIDDGAPTLEASLDIARAAVQDGIDVLAATPHVRADYPTTAALMERRLLETRLAVADAGLPLELVGGGEIDLDFLPGLDDDELRRLSFGGNGALLLEFPYDGWPEGLVEAIRDLRGRGFTVVLAHPERNAEVQERPDRLGSAVDAGAVVQVTAASLDGRLGSRSRSTARRLLDSGLAHLLASDAHAPGVRSIGLSAAAAELDDPALVVWLTRGVPGALLRGEPLPFRPPARPRPRRFRLRRHRT